MKAKDFTLANQDGEEISLSDFKGSHVLLYFYPRDLTSGCTVEAQNFRDNMDALEDLGVVVLGVSCDDMKSHKKFWDKEELNFDLLADVDKKVVQDYGVWVEKSMYGKKYMGIQRDSFLIGPEMEVLKHYKKVKPKTHIEEVLQDLEELKNEST